MSHLSAISSLLLVNNSLDFYLQHGFNSIWLPSVVGLAYSLWQVQRRKFTERYPWHEGKKAISADYAQFAPKSANLTHRSAAYLARQEINKCQSAGMLVVWSESGEWQSQRNTQFHCSRQLTTIKQYQRSTCGCFAAFLLPLYMCIVKLQICIGSERLLNTHEYCWIFWDKKRCSDVIWEEICPRGEMCIWLSGWSW